MLELIILMALVMLALSVGMLLLKFVFALVLLPLKLAFFLTKGLLTLVVVVPLMLILGTVFLAVIPVGPRDPGLAHSTGCVSVSGIGRFLASATTSPLGGGNAPTSSCISHLDPPSSRSLPSRSPAGTR